MNLTSTALSKLLSREAHEAWETLFADLWRQRVFGGERFAFDDGASHWLPPVDISLPTAVATAGSLWAAVPGVSRRAAKIYRMAASRCWRLPYPLSNLRIRSKKRYGTDQEE